MYEPKSRPYNGETYIVGADINKGGLVVPRDSEVTCLGGTDCRGYKFQGPGGEFVLSAQEADPLNGPFLYLPNLYVK